MTTNARRIIIVSFLVLGAILTVTSVRGQGPSFVPNGVHFPNPGGTSSTYSTTGSIDLTGPFFQSLGTNGRTCGSCHLPSDGMSISAAHVEERFIATNGLDPIFRTVDGSNCKNLVDVSTLDGRKAAYSLLRTRGLIRIAIGVPSNADYYIQSVSNPYGCNETNTISMYRRPLPTTNLRFLSAVMFDGRESTNTTDPVTGTPVTQKILYSNYPNALLLDLAHQAVDATNIHAQGNGLTTEQQQQIVQFEMALTTAQTTGAATGDLGAQGANGGTLALLNQFFFISINSSVRNIFYNLLHLAFGDGSELPGGLVAPADNGFTSNIFNTFDAWSDLPPSSPRAAVARGQALFNSTPITITGVAGINDPAASGGLLPGGVPSFTGTCGTCHDTPNVGNHSFPTPLNIGVGDPDPLNPSLSLGGLDISYLPKITVCRNDNSACMTTTDLGQALIDGKFAHVGKLKGPILRGLSARAPYFHNGSAQTLLDAVQFYEKRFGVSFTAQQESDLVAFLSSL